MKMKISTSDRDGLFSSSEGCSSLILPESSRGVLRFSTSSSLFSSSTSSPLVSNIWRGSGLDPLYNAASPPSTSPLNKKRW